MTPHPNEPCSPFDLCPLLADFLRARRLQRCINDDEFYQHLEQAMMKARHLGWPYYPAQKTIG